MSTPTPTTICDADDDFDFDRTWWWVFMVVSIVCILYVYGDYLINKRSRFNPSLLMIGRLTFDFLAVVVVLYAIDTDKISCSTTTDNDNNSICRFWGSLFLFCLYVPAVYYAAICWQLYLTLKNPFRQPSSHSILFHLCVISFVIFLMLFISFVGNNGNGQFVYRPEVSSYNIFTLNFIITHIFIHRLSLFLNSFKFVF